MEFATWADTVMAGISALTSSAAAAAGYTPASITAGTMARKTLPWSACVCCIILFGRDAGRCIATPVVRRTPRAGIPTQQPPNGAGNTVAAQRRILTVFPIYFLRLPAASRVFYRALIVKRRCAPYLTIYRPSPQAPFSFYPVSLLRGCFFASSCEMAAIYLREMYSGGKTRGKIHLTALTGSVSMGA